MPFTFSHPALVLPITYLPARWYSLTALVAGSIAPDFEYFLRMRVRSEFSHTPEGLLWFCLPVGLILCFAFHNVVRNTLFENLPMPLKSRVQGFTKFNWNRHFSENWKIVLVSILVGAASHVLLDNFTHELGFFVMKFQALQYIFGIAGWELPVYKIIQHTSTILGGALVLFAIWKLPKANVTQSEKQVLYWALVSSISVSIVLVRILSGLNPEHYGHVVATAISAIMISMILTPGLMRFIRKSK